MKIQWIANLKEEDKKDFTNLLHNSTTVIDRLKEIVDQEIKSIDRTENSSSSYETPGWSHKQAFLNGKRAALEDIKQLLTI
jgi:hypothetical protein